MMGQMSIFDLMDRIVLEDMSEEEMIAEVMRSTGLEFKLQEYPGYKTTIHEYECKYKGAKFTCNYSKYFDDGARFISCGYSRRKNYEGAGSPCDSIDEAVDFFKFYMQRVGDNNDR